MKLPVTMLLLLAAARAQAHEGHGMPAGTHWHATDALALLALVAGVAATLWWRGRR